jgi:hypothetical protein
MKSPEKSPDKSLLISVQAAHSPGVTEGAGGEVLMCWAVVEMGRFDMWFLPLEMGNLQGIVSGFFFGFGAHINRFEWETYQTNGDWKTIFLASHFHGEFPSGDDWGFSYLFLNPPDVSSNLLKLICLQPHQLGALGVFYSEGLVGAMVFKL